MESYLIRTTIPPMPGIWMKKKTFWLRIDAQDYDE